MNKEQRKLYYNSQWYEFAKKVKHRDHNKCVKCHRTNNQTILQVHHKLYINGLAPWEYSLSDCITLCKGCHAREHKLIEPNKGWTLILITDLREVIGVCERKGCGTDIRYENLIYHPDWGYKNVGRFCLEYLTQEDRMISNNVLKIYTKISKFVHNSIWRPGVSKNGKQFIFSEYKYHMIRIYGNKMKFAIQIWLKEKGQKWYNIRDIIPVRNTNLNQVKELGYIILRGLITENNQEKELLRKIYKGIIKQ